MANKTVKVNYNGELIDVDINSLPINDVLSYSRIDCFKSCEYKYKLKYIEKNYTNDSSLALQIGSILHLGLEFKYLSKYPVYKIYNIVMEGYTDENNKRILGINELKELYPFEWEETDKNGYTYDDKLKIYTSKLHEPIDKEWKCIGCEVEFNIIVEDKAIVKGFIDRVDKNVNTGEIRVVDYKSSKKLYDKKDLATPMQMYIYALACKELYKQYPSTFIYDMILLGETQEAMTKGWQKRGDKALISKLDSLIWHKELNNELLKPKPTPLCHWCSYCPTNLNATDGKDLCKYYSLWTPEDKNWKVNSEWVEPSIEDDGWDGLF